MVSAGVKGQHELLLLLLWSLCVSCLLPGMVNAKCARLEFPTASKMTSLGEVPFVAVPVNQTAHIPFSVNLSSCEHSTASSITMVVAKMGKDNILKEQCKLSGHGKMYGAESCRISNHKGNYSWSKHIDRSDHTYWRWKATFSGKELIRYIRLDVTYPPTLTRLSSLPPSPVLPGSSVSLLCSYEKGNPDVSPVIAGPKGRKLEAHQPRPGEMMHRVEKVSCEDTGSYSCQAPAASSNQTLTLLVKCPLQFTEQMQKMFVVEAYKESRLTFPFRSYTPHLTHCWIVPWSEDSSQSPPTSVLHNKPVNCSSITTVDKTPPAMILTLTLYNVTSHHQGSWNLTVGNDVGSDSVIFAISVSNLPATSSPALATAVSPQVFPITRLPFYIHTTPRSDKNTNGEQPSHDNGDSGPVAGVAIIAIIILIFIISILVFLLDRRYGGRLFRVCRRNTERNQQHPSNQDQWVYMCPVAAGAHNTSGTTPGERTGSHLYAPLNQDPLHVYENPKDPVYSQPTGATPNHHYSWLGDPPAAAPPSSFGQPLDQDFYSEIGEVPPLPPTIRS